MRDENGTIDPYRKTEVTGEESYGLCQLNKAVPAHQKIVDDPRFFTDIRWQIEQCWNEFKENPYQFSSYKKRDRQSQFFTFR